MAETWGKKLLRMISVVVLLALIAYFGVKLIRQQRVLQQQEEKIAAMKAYNDKLAEEYQDRLGQIEDKYTLDYINKYMRAHFGMVKEGETRIDVITEAADEG